MRFRDSTEAKMPAVDVGSGRAGPNLKALVMEKSHASCPPLWDPDIGRPARNIAGSGGSGTGGAIIDNGVSGD